MSSEKTANFNLHKWIGKDYVKRTEFNENFDKIDAEMQSLNNNKVDKVTGKGLSSNDFTTAEKNKLAGLSGNYNDLTNKPTLGTVASKNTGTTNGTIPVIGADNKLDASILPALAITDTFVVNSQASMLALTAQIGDVCVRTDINKTFILKASPATTLANWQELLTPADAVLSVNGKTGAVTLAKGDVGLGNVENYGIATQAEAEAGTLAAKYMTPQRTKQAIDKNLAAHLADNTKHITEAERTAWNAKQKALGYAPVNKAGDTLTGGLTLGLGESFTTWGWSKALSLSMGSGIFWPKGSGVKAAMLGRTADGVNDNFYLVTSDKDDGTGVPTLPFYIDLTSKKMFIEGKYEVFHFGNAGPFYKGTGSPEGVITAPIGAIYQRSDGGTNTTLYVKQSGTGNTGWVAK